MAKIAINLRQGAIHKEELIVGIDLGTTNSLVAYMEGDQVVMVKEEDSQNTLVPSVLHFSKTGQLAVGEAARNFLITHPANTIYSVKRLMGKSYNDIRQFQRFFAYTIIDDDPDSLVKIKINDRFYNPIELSAEILKELKRRTEQQLGQSISKAVITVPAYFNDAQRQATRDAGKLAGLDVLRIINEPTAASLAYGLHTANSQAKIAVYDLGGGTFDISILQLEDGIFEVLSTNGDTFLGGDDLDQAIISYWHAQGYFPDHKLQEQAFMQAMRLGAEEVKKALSAQDRASKHIDGFTLHLSLAEFEELAQPFIERTLVCCSRALKDAGLTVSDIDEVVLVGGSTRIPLIKQKLRTYFGKPIYDKLNPDEVVARGAAIQANILAGKQKDILLLDITPLSLGIETVGGLMDVIIPRNSKIPLGAGRRYTTSVDGQKNLKISVYQGERDLVAENRKLGEFILKDIPPMPAGLPQIEIHFIIDADGILTVRAKELRSGVSQAIEIKSQYGISEEAMSQMLLDSLTHAYNDMQIRALQEAKNEADYILKAAEKFIHQNDQHLSKSQIQKLTGFMQKVREALQTNKKDEILQAIDALNNYSKPLAQKSLERNISAALQGKKI